MLDTVAIIGLDNYSFLSERKWNLCLYLRVRTESGISQLSNGWVQRYSGSVLRVMRLWPETDLPTYT